MSKRIHSYYSFSLSFCRALRVVFDRSLLLFPAPKNISRLVGNRSDKEDFNIGNKWFILGHSYLLRHENDRTLQKLVVANLGNSVYNKLV